MSHNAISIALIALFRIGPPRHRGYRNIPCQSNSMSVGSLPTRKRSCSMMACARVASLPMIEPSPSPVRPSLVRTLQKTQFTLPALTMIVFRPVTFRLSVLAFAPVSRAGEKCGRASRAPFEKRSVRRFIAPPVEITGRLLADGSLQLRQLHDAPVQRNNPVHVEIEPLDVLVEVHHVGVRVGRRGRV